MSLNIDSEMLLKHFPACQWSAGCVSAWGIIQHWVSFKNSQSLKPPPTPQARNPPTSCSLLVHDLQFHVWMPFKQRPPLSLEKCYSSLCRIMNEERGKKSICATSGALCWNNGNTKSKQREKVLPLRCFLYLSSSFWSNCPRYFPSVCIFLDWFLIKQILLPFSISRPAVYLSLL